MVLGNTTSLLVGLAAVLVGILAAIVGGKAAIKSDRTGRRIGGWSGALVGLLVAAFGIWYAAVGGKYGKVQKAKHREAGQQVRALVRQFGDLLAKCREDVFPHMVYKPSAQAKANGYKKAISVMQEELLKCYTGSEDMGEEKQAELDQIQWLVAKKDCKQFAHRLLKERAFCDQMIDALPERGDFIDPLAAAGKQAPRKAGVSPQVKEGLGKLAARLSKCSGQVLAVYAPPAGKDPKAATKEAVAAMVAAFQSCAKGEGGEELPEPALKKLLDTKDCEALASALKNMDVCTPALEAPTKVGWTFKMGGGQGGGKTGPSGAQAREGSAKAQAPRTGGKVIQPVRVKIPARK